MEEDKLLKTLNNNEELKEIIENHIKSNTDKFEVDFGSSPKDSMFDPEIEEFGECLVKEITHVEILDSSCECEITVNTDISVSFTEDTNPYIDMPESSSLISLNADVKIRLKISFDFDSNSSDKIEVNFNSVEDKNNQ